MGYKLKYMLAVFIYGTIGYILHFVSFPSEMVVLARGTIGSLFIFFYARLTGHPLEKENIRRNLKYLILSGISLGLNWVFLFASYRSGSVAVGSLCNYMAPIILVALSPVLYKEKISLKKGLCILGALIGFVLVSGVLEGGNAVHMNCVILGLLAALAFVLLIIFNRKLDGVSVFEKVIVQLSVSAITVFPYVIINNLHTPIDSNIRSILLLILLGIVHTGIAYCLYFGSINEVEVQTLAIIGYIEPVVSIITSAVLLHEPISIFGFIGAVMILTSACISELIR